MSKVDIITENLTDLIKHRYRYAQNTRSEEYASYNDFQDRFVKPNASSDVLDAFSRCAEQLSDGELTGLFWLASSYNIQFFREIPDLVGRVSDSKKIKFLEYYYRKIDGLGDAEIGLDLVTKKSLQDEFDRLKNI